MNRFKPVLKWLAIVFGILSGIILLSCLYLCLTVGNYEYGGTVPWRGFNSMWALGFACLGVSIAGLVLYRFHSKLKRLKPVLKWLAIGFGILITLFLLFVLEENIRGKIALHSYLRQLRGQGERLSLGEMELPKLPKDSNGVTALLALTNEFDSLRRECPFPVDLRPRFILPASGHAIVRCDQPDLGVNIRSAGETTVGRRGRPAMSIGRNGQTNAFIYYMADWDDLAGQVAKASNVLEQTRQALNQPVLSMEIDYTQGFDLRLPHIQAIHNAETWLRLAALHDLRQRNAEAATRDILAMARLSHCGQDEHLLISQVRRWQCGMTGLNLTWEALQISDWTDEQLSELEQAWRESSVIQNSASILEMDRLFYRNGFERARQFPQWSALRTFLFDCGRGDSPPANLSEFFSDVRDGLHAVTWRMAWLDQDELRFLHRYQLMLDHARIALAHRDWSAFGLSDKDFPYARSYYDRKRFLLSDAYTPNVELVLRRVFEFETQREMTIAAIAIRRYQLRTGKLPSALTALVPEYLSELPHDWLDGKPLRYHQNPDGPFTLYSVGSDGRDDGGDSTPSEGKRAYTIWNERDAVWPMPASEEDIAAFNRQTRELIERGRRGLSSGK